MRYAILLTLVTALVINACKKNDSSLQYMSFMDSAKTVFQTDIGDSRAPNDRVFDLLKIEKKPLWEKAKELALSAGKCLLVPLKYSHSSYIKSNFANGHSVNISDCSFMLAFKHRGKFEYQVLTVLPDSQYFKAPGHSFSGILFLNAWDGRFISQIKKDADGKVMVAKEFITDEISHSQRVSDDFLICYETYGYNYSPADNYYYYWQQPAGCSYVNVGGGYQIPYSGGLATQDYVYTADVAYNSATISSYDLPLVNGNKPIANLPEYVKCFNNVSGNEHIYKVKVCVDQPVPGSRESWGLASSSLFKGGSLVNVGHAFLVLAEKSIGYEITRNVGLYPQSIVYPADPIDVGVLNNDELHAYNISLTITLTNKEFFQILDYLSNLSKTSVRYDLNRFNCTSFVLRALGAAGINLPATIGQWPGGSGYNPGDLGEDIRTMSLSPNMTRSTNYTMHVNQFLCN